MKFKNTSDWPDHFLRRMLAWVQKQIADKPIVKIAQFRNKSYRYRGYAHYWTRKISVSVSPNSTGYPVNHSWCRAYTSPDGSQNILPDPIAGLVHVTAHEVGHLIHYACGHQGRGSEARADAMARIVTKRFAEQREALLAEWNSAPVEKPKAVADPVQRRMIKAAKALARWERKLALAKTKVKQYQRKVGYYDRKAATKGMSNG